ncbi:MAG TPA: serine/threonine-protein kinase [Polyangiaceae bacterium]|nr:serine/threonine-protein kinase [Polyangiaceae bacterium]
MSGTNTKSKTNPHMASEVDDTIGPGDEIGRYQLISRLASGGMGEVWTAKATGSGFARTVALKLVRSEMSGDENYARMFIDEATVASSIHHPNVCETYELGKHGDRLFMAMEWIAGDSLAGLLRQGDYLVALDVRIAARIIADACAGLHAAHETVGPDGASLGVVHRDISPPNILVSMQGQAKVSDFGIAKARHQLHERTKTGEVKGKFAYIAPEQITGHPVDRRADVYAMGCVLYVATLGSRPFGNGADALRKILSNKYKAPRSLREDFPEGLEAIIVRALLPNPDDRFATAEDMQIALEEWLMSSGKLVTASDVAKCVKERMNSDVRAHNEALLSQNRVAPDRMMNQLVSSYEHETPTAGSGLVAAPSSLWVGKGPRPAAGAPAPAPAPAADLDEPTHTREAVTEQAQVSPTGERLIAPQRPVVPPRASDATGLVDFVPIGADAKSRRAPAPTAAISVAPHAIASAPPTWLARNGRALLIVILAVDAALLAWRLLAR